MKIYWTEAAFIRFLIIKWLLRNVFLFISHYCIALHYMFFPLTIKTTEL